MANIITQLFGTSEEKSQNGISKWEAKVIKLYGILANRFPDRKDKEEKLAQMQEETLDFHQNNEELLFVLGNIKEEKQMKTSRFAYRAIPVIDAALALFPLLAIVEKEWTTIPLFEYPLAIGLGLFFSLIGRWTANELIKETGRKQWAYICVFIVPSIYWINFWGFNNGTLIFTILFSMISGGVQFFIIYFFPGLHDAVSYFEIKKKYNRLLQKENKQKDKLAKHTQDFSKKFYTDLWQAYHNLHTAFQAHTERFGNNPSISLSQILLCVCNLAFYNYEAIPYRRRNGQVEGAALIVDAPELQEIFMTNEVRFFAYMLKQSGRSSRLTELIPQTNSTFAITDSGVREQLPTVSTPVESPDMDTPASERPEVIDEEGFMPIDESGTDEKETEEQEFAIW